MNRCTLVAAALAGAGWLAGCSTSQPAPVLLSLPPTLGTAAPIPMPPAAPPAATAPAAAASSATAAPLLAVRRVAIPEYLVARRVRYRADPSTLAEWPNTYWAERIEIGVTREFISALRQQMPGWSFCDTNCGDAVPLLNLQVDLVPMDYVRSERALHARARITLSGPGTLPRPIDSREFGYDVSAGADTAQAQAQAIATLLQQVAAATAPLVLKARP